MTEGVQLALIAAVASTILSLATLLVGVWNTRKIGAVQKVTEQVHIATNGMSKRLEEAEFAKGKKEGVAEEVARVKEEDP